MASSLALAFDILARDRASQTIDKVGDSAEEAGGKLEKLGTVGTVALGAVATGAAALGATAVKGFMDGLEQDAMTDKLGASLGLNPAESAELGRVAGDLYADAYGDSFGSVMDAVSAVRGELGDLGAENIEGLTANALDFATAFDFDVAQSVGAAGTLLRNGLVKDGEHAFDLLTETMQRVPATARDEVFAATQEYSTFFSDLGLSGEAAFAMMADAAESGGTFGIDKVGDALKELTIRATDMSEGSKEAFWKAGLSAGDMAERFLAGGDEARGALVDLVDGLVGIEDPVEQANAAIALFGTPLEDLGTSEIPAFLDSLSMAGEGMAGVAGSADELGDTLNDNLSTKIETWKRKGLQAMTDLMIERVIPAVERFAPVVQDGFGRAADIVGDVAGSITRFLDDNRDTIDKLGATVERVVGGVIGWFSQAKSDIGNSSSELGRIVGQLRDLFDTYLEAIGVAVETVVKVVTDLWDRFGDDIITYFRETWDNAKEILAGAIDFITGIFEIFIAVFTGDWGRLWEGIKQTLSGAWNAIRGIVEQALNILQTIVGIALGALSAVWSTAWNSVKTLVFDIWEGIKGIVSGSVDAVVGFFSGLGGKISEKVSGAFDGILEAFKGIVQGIVRAWNRLDLEIDIKVPGWVPGLGGKGWHSPDLIPDLPVPQFALGVRGFQGGWALVGERGPELLELPRGANVYSHGDTLDMLGSRSAPLVGGDYIVQVLPEQDPIRRGMYELERIALKNV